MKRNDQKYCSSKCQMAHYRKLKKSDIIKKQADYYNNDKKRILERQKIYYHKNRKSILEKQLEYTKTHDKKEYLKKYREENKEKYKEYYKQPIVKFKTSVRNKTRNHYRKTNVCNICGKEGKTEFHHPDYNPDLFQELCIPCHKNIDRGRIYNGKGGKA
jgi:hypothetical protein